ncbi:hypothetical protein [Enterococcus casseliflavus]|jgi:hypothetical protein|uniref:hypothetical protein n=1 Tax=Enterococcus casseliflavus TaxID=37734 RepID=UPI0022DFE490|nr:hypothetical protein [Enterococcus casseliflavus]
MSDVLKFQRTIDYFYESLSQSIAKRIKKLGVTRDEVLPDPTRVTAIIKNRRTKKHPYLIGEREYNNLYNLFKFDTREEVARQELDNDNFVEVVEEYGVDRKTGKRGIIQKEKFVDPNNYDDMVWGHIDWEKIFNCILEDIQKLDYDDELNVAFRHTLLNYVPFAIDSANFEVADNNHFSDFFMKEPPVYFPIEVESPMTGEIEIQSELVFGDEIFNQLEQNERKAIEWVYIKNKSQLIDRLKEAFLSDFKGKRLQKFDRHFNYFLLNIMYSFITENEPKTGSFGLQAYNYMKDILETKLVNENINFSYTDLKVFRPEGWGLDEDGNFYPDYSDEGDVREEEIDVFTDYIRFAKKHLEGLQKFQLEFEKARNSI